MHTLVTIVNTVASPTTIYLGAVTLFFLAMWKMEFFVQPKVAGSLGGLVVLFFAASLFDPHFREIVLLPDNIPITLMLSSVGYLTWYALYKGVENDRREKGGEPLLEKEQSRKMMTWPNLVFIEFIALIGITIFLIIWSVVFQAPLEDPANPNITPNPSKAPWYFLGLQEMLVYFDPWLAGVVFPGLIIVGLMAIPYLDKNPKGNGAFTFRPRQFIIGYYLYGFLIQWVLLIMLGTFMRGPGWNFFGPYEDWDPHKVVSLTNINLSELIWVRFLHTGLPQNILIREAPGFLAVAAYLGGLPALLGKTILKKFKENLNTIQYALLSFLFLALVSLPIKMILRWTINLKYIIAIPEFFFNI